jgi:hypothetical protein
VEAERIALEEPETCQQPVDSPADPAEAEPPHTLSTPREGGEGGVDHTPTAGIAEDEAAAAAAAATAGAGAGSAATAQPLYKFPRFGFFARPRKWLSSRSSTTKKD